MSEPQTVKGMYINNTLEHVEKVKGRPLRAAICQRLGLPVECGSLRAYPVRELTRVMDAATPEIFPGLKREQAAYQWGVLGFQTFSESFIGKIGLTLVTSDLERLLTNIPSYYSLSGRLGPITVTKEGARTWRIAFRDLNGYTEYQHGMVTTALERLGHQCRVSHTRLSFDDRGDGDLWTAADLLIENLKV